jgi:hypothetical protein
MITGRFRFARPLERITGRFRFARPLERITLARGEAIAEDGERADGGA